MRSDYTLGLDASERRLHSSGAEATQELSGHGRKPALRRLIPTPLWRDGLASLSLANLCFLYVWSKTPPYLSSKVEYFLREPHQNSHYVALVMNVSVLGGFLWWALRRIRSLRQKWVEICGRVAFLVVFAVALNSIRLVLSPLFPHALAWVNWQRRLGQHLSIALLSIAGLALMLVLWRCPGVIFRSCAAILLMLSPLVPVNFSQAVRMSLREDRGRWLATPKPRQHRSVQAQNRVVLILYDEWDYRLTFEERLSDLELPGWDRFRRESINCERAFPPGNGTMQSIPGITTGQRMWGVRVTGPGDLLVLKAGEARWEPWRKAHSVFERAAEGGYSMAIVGWFMPYCRIFGDLCTTCEWWPASFVGFPQARGVAESSLLQMRALLETRGLSPFGQTIELQQYIESHQGVLRGAKVAAANPDLDFVFLHLPMTHWPFYYDRLTCRFDRRWNHPRAYWDALALGDRVLSELRQAMVASGTWDSSTIVLTSDHSYRDSDLIDRKHDARVPLLIKWRNSEAPASLSAELNTQVLPDFVLAALGGAIVDEEQAVRWLMKQAQSVAPPQHSEIEGIRP